MTKITKKLTEHEQRKNELMDKIARHIDKTLLDGAESIYKEPEDFKPEDFIEAPKEDKVVIPIEDELPAPPEYVEAPKKDKVVIPIEEHKKVEPTPEPIKRKPIEPKPDSSLTEKPLNKFMDKIKDFFAPAHTYLIEMNHYNGTVSHFIASVKRGTFKHNEGSYVIDEAVKIYCNTTKLYMLRFHEGFAMPIEFKVEAQELKDMLPDSMKEQESDYKIDTSFNPWVLLDVLKGEYTKGVLAGAEVSVLIKRIFLISMICLGAIIIHLGLNAYKSGWI